MDIELKAVRTSADRKAYALFPFSLFKKEPLWVPPLLQDELKVLDPAKNPSLKFSPHAPGNQLQRRIGGENLGGKGVEKPLPVHFEAGDGTLHH